MNRHTLSSYNNFSDKQLDRVNHFNLTTFIRNLTISIFRAIEKT